MKLFLICQTCKIGKEHALCSIMYNNCYSDCTYDNFMTQHGVRAKYHYVVVASEINSNEDFISLHAVSACMPPYSI